MIEFIELVKGPWHWSVAGLFIGLTVPALLLLGNKKFGVSSSLRHICAATVPAGIPFFNYDWKKESWNLFFVTGIFFGALFAQFYLNDPNNLVVSEKTIAAISQYTTIEYNELLPREIFNWGNLTNMTGFIFIILGGFMVGFGTRYAGGCTSGHAIMGLSNLQWPSLVATVCFFIGGLVVTHFIYPFIF